jgi:hypothetical protein
LAIYVVGCACNVKQYRIDGREQILIILLYTLSFYLVKRRRSTLPLLRENIQIYVSVKEASEREKERIDKEISRKVKYKVFFDELFGSYSYS